MNRGYKKYNYFDYTTKKSEDLMIALIHKSYKKNSRILIIYEL